MAHDYRKYDCEKLWNFDGCFRISTHRRPVQCANFVNGSTDGCAISYTSQKRNLIDTLQNILFSRTVYP